MEKIRVAGDYANLRLLVEELEADEDFVGELNLGQPAQTGDTGLDHASWSELVIWVEQGLATGGAGAVAKIAVEAAIKRARGRGKITQEEPEE